MRFLLVILMSGLATSLVFADNKNKVERLPANDEGKFYCQRNPKSCKEIAYPTVSFVSGKKYKIAYSESVVGVLTSICLDAGFKSYAAGTLEFIDRTTDQDTLFYTSGHNGTKTGAFVSGLLAGQIISKVVCSPE